MKMENKASIRRGKIKKRKFRQGNVNMLQIERKRQKCMRKKIRSKHNMLERTSLEFLVLLIKVALN